MTVFPTMEDVWQPIASAPADVELELGIYDKGEYYALASLVGARALAGAMSAPIVPCGLSRPIGGFGIAGARNPGRSPRRFGLLIDLDQSPAI
jgi:hypothetical protein